MDKGCAKNIEGIKILEVRGVPSDINEIENKEVKDCCFILGVVDVTITIGLRGITEVIVHRTVITGPTIRPIVTDLVLKADLKRDLVRLRGIRIVL